jgi:putative oxidoreductase
MDRLYSRFPGGGVGYGLLLLRIIVAAWFFDAGIPMFGVSPATFVIALVLVSVAVLLIAGAGTSANASIGAVCCIGLLLRGFLANQWFSVLSLAALSGSLALLGPGGYSLDARLSGWRTIDLSSRPPSDQIWS